MTNATTGQVFADEKELIREDKIHTCFKYESLPVSKSHGFNPVYCQIFQRINSVLFLYDNFLLKSKVFFLKWLAGCDPF